jgi:hypothetical protein
MTSDFASVPSRSDIERHRPLLIEFMEQFPFRAPILSDIVAGTLRGLVSRRRFSAMGVGAEGSVGAAAWGERGWKRRGGGCKQTRTSGRMRFYVRFGSIDVRGDLSVAKRGIVGLDDFYRNQLSKTTVKKHQRRWAVIDANSVRYLLCYIFSSVRTGQGRTSARYAALAELKSLVQSAAVSRRQQALDPDLDRSNNARSKLWLHPRAVPPRPDCRAYGLRCFRNRT